MALASEVLAERWTFLVIRELMVGATRFNEIRRGVPRLSATLLKQRLQTLEHAGILERKGSAEQRPFSYRLTQAGLNTTVMPAGRTIIEIEFTDMPARSRRFWLIHREGSVEVCLKDPGYESSLRVSARVRTLAEVWRGLRSLKDELRAGTIMLAGSSEHCRAFPQWLLLSAYAAIKRER